MPNFTVAFLVPFMVSGAAFSQGPIEGEQYVKKDAPRNIQVQLQKGQPKVIDDYKLEIVFKGLNEKGRTELDINFSERAAYDGKVVEPDGTSEIRNRSDVESADLLDYAERLYRTHRTCTGALEKEKWKNGKAIVDLRYGYKNITGADRFYEQCVSDGSFDVYYEEYLDYGCVTFAAGETKNGHEFAIKLVSAMATDATIAIIYTGRGRYKPTGKEFIRPKSSHTTHPYYSEPYSCPAPTPFDNLRELKKLLDEGVINKNDFKKKKKEQLDRIK